MINKKISKKPTNYSIVHMKYKAASHVANT